MYANARLFQHWLHWLVVYFPVRHSFRGIRLKEFYYYEQEKSNCVAFANSTLRPYIKLAKQSNEWNLNVVHCARNFQTTVSYKAPSGQLTI